MTMLILLLSLFSSCFAMFRKKIIVLLIFEAVMLVCIFNFKLNTMAESFSFLMFMILSIFMVMDSVFGVCVLISSTRDTSHVNKIFF